MDITLISDEEDNNYAYIVEDAGFHGEEISIAKNVAQTDVEFNGSIQNDTSRFQLVSNSPQPLSRRVSLAWNEIFRSIES